MSKVIIWRESAYRTGKCNACGERVRDIDGNPMPFVMYDKYEGNLYCARCMNLVGKVKDTSYTTDELMDMVIDQKGHWEEGL